VSEDRGQEVEAPDEPEVVPITEVMVVIGRDAHGANRIEIRGGMHPGMAAALLQQWALQLLGSFSFNRPKPQLVQPATVVTPRDAGRTH